MFVLLVLFLTAPNWKQSKCLLITECTNKLWYIHKILDSNIRDTDTYHICKTWMTLKCVIQNERHQTMANNALFYLCNTLWKPQSRGTENRAVFARAWRCRGMGETTKGHRRTFGGDENVLYLDFIVLVACLYVCVKFIQLYT